MIDTNFTQEAEGLIVLGQVRTYRKYIKTTEKGKILGYPQK